MSALTARKCPTLLWVLALTEYDLFHLLDYPIFLGLAAFFILSGLGLKLGGLRPLDIARWGAGITLMWASIEKWAYPQWTYPLLVEHPKLAFGWDQSFYMTAAGVIEFGLAFGLIWTPLVRRLAAVVLSALFISAIFEFGKIDAIGHLMIIAILLGVIADDSRGPSWRPLRVPVFYTCALAGILITYYGLHAVLFKVS